MRCDGGVADWNARRCLSRTARRRNAQRGAAVAMDSRQTRCYVSWHRRTAPVEIQVFSVAKFGNDDQCPGAENSHADRSDPNAVTEGSRMDCRIEFSVPHDGRKRELEGVYPPASIFRQRQHPSGHRQSRLQQEQTGCCKLVDAPSRPISGSGRLGIRRDAPRHTVIAMGSRHISCYVLWHPTAPVKMQRFSVAKLGNDGKDSGAENLYASRSDPNSVSEGSRLGC